MVAFTLPVRLSTILFIVSPIPTRGAKIPFANEDSASALSLTFITFAGFFINHPGWNDNLTVASSQDYSRQFRLTEIDPSKRAVALAHRRKNIFSRHPR